MRFFFCHIAWAGLLLAGSLASVATAKLQARLDQSSQNGSITYPPNGPLVPTTPPVDGSSYDYIVIGSGPGGGPLAARLALANFSVLLIDAGEDHGTERAVQVPALHILASEYESMRWNYFVDHYADNVQAARDTKMTYWTPESKYYSGLTPPKGSMKLGIWYPRSGALGGCAVHNALISVLPSGEDWEGIRALTGDDSWGEFNMKNYFTKLEECGYRRPETPGHGFSGWFKTQIMQIELIAEDTKVIALAISAFVALGNLAVKTVSDVLATMNKDINSAAPEASKLDKLYQIPLAMSATGYVRSTPRDFVVEVASATNPDGTKKYPLTIALGTLVNKINFDTTSPTPRASSVSYLFETHQFRADPSYSTAGPGVPGTVSATREIILAAGSFNTPQLLKLSGIGPTTELASLGIPVIHDSPGVGSNLQDRYEVGVIGQGSDDFLLLEGCTFISTESDPCYIRWANPDPAADKGPYATNTVLFGLIRRSSVAEPGSAPDLYIAGVPANFEGYFPGYAHKVGADHKHWTWLILKAHSRNSAGTVNITTTDARDVPKINFRSFDEGTGGASGTESQQDLQAVYEGVQFAIRALEGMVPVDGRPWAINRVWPPPEMKQEAEIKQWIKDEAWGHHACCTAKIGGDGDAMAVLDSKFNVRGVSGLRVVDASVFPKIPGLFIAVPTYMISEKAADVIIADAKPA